MLSNYLVTSKININYMSTLLKRVGIVKGSFKEGWVQLRVPLKKDGYS